MTSVQMIYQSKGSFSPNDPSPVDPSPINPSNTGSINDSGPSASKTRSVRRRGRGGMAGRVKEWRRWEIISHIMSHDLQTCFLGYGSFKSIIDAHLFFLPDKPKPVQDEP